MSTLFEKPGRHRTLAALGVLAMLAAACSDTALLDLGGRSSDWIGEVATTGSTTTTTLPDLTKAASAVDWVNDGLSDPPAEGADGAAVLADVFARSDGENSRFLQASRAEIAAVTPEVEVPAEMPASVFYVTSQLVIESRTLRLANEPTVAFGLWSVEPYTRSRSIGQVAVINVATDAAASEVANDPNTEPTCTAFTQVEDRVCGIEQFTTTPVWRLESETGVVHLWYRGPYRYELTARSDVDEEVVHEVIGSMAPIGDVVVSG